MPPIQTEIVVVGAGPGGYAAAFYAADLGKKVMKRVPIFSDHHQPLVSSRCAALNPHF